MYPEKITLDSLMAMPLPPIIVYAIPVMLGLVVVEWLIGLHENRELYEKKDFFSSAAIGIGNLVSTALSKVVMFAFILWLYNLTPLRIPPTWWSYALCWVVLDFCSYWAHRLAHEKRFWWATHVTHHSSPNYNFAVSFRLSWVQQLKIVFFMPVALLGFHPVVFYICNQFAVLYQFWLHTELIRKMPRWFEYVFVTPSHHRVHHGSNPQYIDKNYGAFFIIWDRMFGTYEPEVEQAIYGITKPVDSHNPVTLVFHEYVDIYHDLKTARSLRDVNQILWGPPGSYERPTPDFKAAKHTHDV